MYRISLAPALGRQPEIARSVLRYPDQRRVSELARPCVHRVEARDLGARELPRGREEGDDRAVCRGGHDSGGRDYHCERLREM